MFARVLKVIGGALALAVLIAIGGVTWLVLRKPAARPASTEVIERTAARLRRGEYVVVHVSDCFGCHSEPRVDLYGAPPRVGTLGQGGFVFDKDYGVPGLLCAQNITPDPVNGIGNWTDGEVMRAFREGVDRNGDALFPMMPYRYYHSMSDDDARAVVAFLRSLPPVTHAVPVKKIDFPVNLLVKGVPQPLEGPVLTPDDAKDHLGYGRYLVTVAGCRECHTAHDDHGNLLPGRDYAGGWEMKMPAAEGPPTRVVSANITPDPDAFFGKKSRQEWTDLVHSFAIVAEAPPKCARGSNTFMPWIAFSGMTDQDLAAIYDFMKTVPPVKNEVEPFPDRT
jgi:mono/diheme cytochrome c family protein